MKDHLYGWEKITYMGEKCDCFFENFENAKFSKTHMKLRVIQG
jgi:hypothetical protein